MINITILGTLAIFGMNKVLYYDITMNCIIIMLLVPEISCYTVHTVMYFHLLLFPAQLKLLTTLVVFL